MCGVLGHGRISCDNDLTMMGQIYNKVLKMTFSESKPK
jgi:hypothetical protein